MSSRSPKDMSYKFAFKSMANIFPEAYFGVAVGRKSYFSLPLIFDGNLPMKSYLIIEYSSGSSHVPFALYFDELSSHTAASSESNQQPNSIANRLAGITNEGSSFVAPRKTLIAFSTSSKSSSKKMSHKIPASQYGVYTLVWYFYILDF